MTTNRRAGFTLTELLVVIGILLVLSALSLAIFSTGKSSDKMRSGARTAQSAFLGAKDRALHAKDLRGVRLTRDLTNPSLVNGFVYLQPLPLQSIGNTSQNPGANDFDITRPGLPVIPDATKIVIFGQEGQTLYRQDVNGIWPSSSVQIRIPSGTGQWFQLSRQNSSSPFWVTPDPNNAANGTDNYWMFMSPGYPGGNAPPVDAILPLDVGASCDIQLGNDMLPFHAPITLPSGCVIDLAYCSQNVQAMAGIGSPNSPNIDVMFSPRGNVAGPTGGLGVLCLTLRDIRDATRKIDPADATTQGDCLILAVFPQTGLVQTFDADLTDAVVNAAGLPGADGKADNLFSFVQKGQSAGR